jgi:hypothetical protein
MEEQIKAKTVELLVVQELASSTSIDVENRLNFELHALLEEEKLKWNTKSKGQLTSLWGSKY